MAANAGAALYVAGSAGTLREGVERAMALIAGGDPLHVLRRLARRSGELASHG